MERHLDHIDEYVVGSVILQNYFASKGPRKVVKWPSIMNSHKPKGFEYNSDRKLKHRLGSHLSAKTALHCPETSKKLRP